MLIPPRTGFGFVYGMAKWDWIPDINEEKRKDRNSKTPEKNSSPG
jgi:hypothetical protein